MVMAAWEDYQRKKQGRIERERAEWQAEEQNRIEQALEKLVKENGGDHTNVSVEDIRRIIRQPAPR